MRHMRVYRWVGAVMALLLVAGLFVSGTALAQVITQVRISPGHQAVCQGSVFTVDVYVEPAVAIAGAQFKLSFDPTRLTANSVVEGNLLKQNGASTHFNAGNISNAAGTISEVYGVITSRGQTVSSPGVFATIEFAAKTTAGASALMLSDVVVGNASGQAVPIELFNGQATVAEACQWAGMVVDPTPANVGNGSIFAVNIRVTITGGQAVDFAEAHVNFDPAKLEVLSIAPGLLPTVLESKYDNALGTFDFGAGVAFGTPAPTTDFVLASVQLRAKQVSAGTPLTFVYQPPTRNTDAFRQGGSVLNQVAVYDGKVVIRSCAELDGKVTLQGRPTPPNDRWILPLRVVLFQPGVCAVLGSHNATTNNQGEFAVPCAQSGSYDVGVKGRRSLSRVVPGVVLPGGIVNFGTLLEGDANNDDYVGGNDYSLLYVNYGKSTADALEKCDFNADGIVGGADYSLLYVNYGKAGEMCQWPLSP